MTHSPTTKILAFASFLAVAFACSATANGDCKRKLPSEPKFISFADFKEAYKKIYPSEEDIAARQKLYDERVEKAKVAWKEYVNGLRPTYLGINTMSDWTEEELAKLNAKSLSSLSASEQSFEYSPPEKKPTGISRILGKMCTWTGKNSIKYDISKSKCFSKPIFQGACASDYVLSASSFYEYIWCKEETIARGISRQFLLDCGPKAGLAGCDGGSSFADIHTFAHKMGLQFPSDYGTYKGKQQQCPYENGDKKAGEIKAVDANVVAVEPADFEKYLSKKIPLYITVAVNDEFEQYSGGVDDGWGCQKSKGRAMLLVGSGIEDGSDYWLLRGTLGSDWGKAGHYKLNKNSKCLMGPAYAPARVTTLSVFSPNKNNLFRWNPHYPTDHSRVKEDETFPGFGY